jgi:hypothetical protein
MSEFISDGFGGGVCTRLFLLLHYITNQSKKQPLSRIFSLVLSSNFCVPLTGNGEFFARGLL